jgi:hypothetical protein
MILVAAVVLAGVLAGAVTAISGFGIGSLLTPVLASHVFRPAVSLLIVSLGVYMLVHR